MVYRTQMYTGFAKPTALFYERKGGCHKFLIQKTHHEFQDAIKLPGIGVNFCVFKLMREREREREGCENLRLKCGCTKGKRDEKWR
jgi:hypothetical protein